MKQLSLVMAEHFLYGETGHMYRQDAISAHSFSRAVHFWTSLICILIFLDPGFIFVIPVDIRFLLDQKHLYLSILFSYMHHIMMNPPPNFTAGTVFLQWDSVTVFDIYTEFSVGPVWLDHS